MKDDFVSLFLEYSKEYESPGSFWRWAAYSTVAATLRTNAHYSQGLLKTFPNIYVVFLADSAEFRKSAPFRLLSKLLSDVDNTKIISGHASIQGVLDVLSQDIASNGASGMPLKGGSSILIARELASFFVDDPKLLPMLTDIYDYDPLFRYLLKGNLIQIKDLCVNFIGASNTEFFTDIYNTRATYGGLLRRTFIITPDERRKANSLINYEENKELYGRLLAKLKEIAQLNGKFEMSLDAFKVYDEWYKDTYKTYSEIVDRTGFIQSIHISVLKISMILAASEGTLAIRDDHIKDAIMRTLALRENYTKLIMRAGKTDPAKVGGIILEELMNAPDNTVASWEFHSKHWQDFTSQEFDEMITTLTRADFVISKLDKEGKPCYQATQKCIDKWKTQS